ncbi:MAG: group 1 truncated hemoglobin [Gammaproteobacteria bacterium]|nr:group 1 truncated hemoglobin [Gammaproteobacteria bacterium]NIR83582.1 group 1 truncated hemoglobin [Gammaproteobacteria bacterium]NIR91504.1 group 1 truncated hemoglobin [Gammaproteobacteria bacterium]NIU04744.1 group 1 truncated hemoglobin [Gammaproteobacteria bacterium]NIV51786.1 group 1 truncated hemoglobin [Gammaproteobacteria bacterium]
MAATMFERYGGFAKVSRIVSEFYDRVLDSSILRPYFEDVDMQSLVDHQTKFVASLMGGPASYTNEALQRIHARLGVTDEAFMEMLNIFRETLEDLGIAEGDVSTVYRDMMSRKPFIVSK